MNADEFYPYEILQDWGKDFPVETRAEVWRTLLTPLNSVAFQREDGTLLEQTESNPNNQFLNVIIPLSIQYAFSYYNSYASGERRVLSGDELIQISDDNKSQGEKTASVSYYREAEQNLETVLL